MNEEQAWHQFQQTGSVRDYLNYAHLIQSMNRSDWPEPIPGYPLEDVHANQYRRPDPQGNDRG